MKAIIFLFIIIGVLCFYGCETALTNSVDYKGTTYYFTENIFGNSTVIEYSGYNIGINKIYIEKNLAQEPVDIYVRKAGIYHVYSLKVENIKSCEVDLDCGCGKDSNGNCAYGNMKYINVEEQCPDYCTGIAANFEIVCKNLVCTQQKIQEPCVKEGESLGAVVLGNTKECCEGLSPYIPKGILGTRGTCQKPEYGRTDSASCKSDSDCTAKECCHAKECVNQNFKQPCNMMCTMNCEPGTMDCGQGQCVCQDNKCTAQIGENI